MATDYATSDYTELKIDHFGKIAAMHLCLSREVLRRSPWASQRYHYFDVTAGPGTHDAIGPQCPLVFAKEVAELNPPMNVQACFVEKDQESASQLANVLRDHLWANIRHGDHCECLPGILATSLPQKRDRYFGMIFYDPVPSKDMHKSIRLLADLFGRKEMQRIDCLMYLSGTTFKRLKDFTNDSLQSLINAFPKQHWLIRDTFGSPHQWTFLLGSNYTSLKEYRGIRLHRLASEEGQQVFRRLTLTREELEQQGHSQQGWMFR